MASMSRPTWRPCTPRWRKRLPARASGAERWAGRIAVGCIADLTVFAADPLRVPAWDLPSVPVDMTVVDGRVRHRTE